MLFFIICDKFLLIHFVVIIFFLQFFGKVVISFFNLPVYNRKKEIEMNDKIWQWIGDYCSGL